MTEEALPGWPVMVAVLAVVALLGVLVVVGVRDWIRETAADRAERQRRKS